MSKFSIDGLSQRGTNLYEFAKFALRTQTADALRDIYDASSNADGNINMSISENYLIQKEVTDFLNENLKVDKDDILYNVPAPISKRQYDILAQFYTKYFKSNMPINTDRIVFTNGVTSINDMLAWCLGNNWDAILAPRPIYQAFREDFALRSIVSCIYVDFEGACSNFDEQFLPSAVQYYRKSIEKAKIHGVRVRAILLCNPHNPLGRCYPRETIMELIKLCSEYEDMHLICDEVYALSVYAGVPKAPICTHDGHMYDLSEFTSILSLLSKDLPLPLSRIHHIYGVSKDFGLGGFRVAFVYSPENDTLVRTLRSIVRFHAASNFCIKAVMMILSNEQFLASAIDTSRNRLASQSLLTAQLLRDNEIPFVENVCAGLFFMLDLRKYLPREELDPKDKPENLFMAYDIRYHEAYWKGENELTKHIIKHKVILTPGRHLAATEPGWFRLIFAINEQDLRLGIARLSDALKSFATKSASH